LDRQAVVYLRQSTMHQVEHNTGSTAHQRNQEAYALRWGWPKSRIKVIDEDLGLSGTSTAKRKGWQQLLKMVLDGEVGAIFAADISRLNRSTRDFGTLVDLCRDLDVRLVVDGQVANLDDPNDRVFANMRAIFAEYENDVRKGTLAKARWAAARQGRAVQRPPAGYIPERPGQWRKDPNQWVQESITRLFDDFERLGSIGKVLRLYYAQGIQLPVLKASGVQKERPYRARIHQMLTNPAYKGDCVFGRTICVRGRQRRQPDPEKVLTLRGHHEPYVTPERWARIQAQLRENNVTVRQPPGKGPALCQGIIYCGRCKRERDLRILVNVQYYSRKTGQGIRYVCNQESREEGGPLCSGVHGDPLDAVVVAELLRKLRPPDLEAAIAAAADTNAGYHSALRQRDAELQTAKADVAFRKRQLDAVAPEYYQTRRDLLGDVERALERLAAVEHAQRDNPPVPPLVPTPKTIAAIHRLAQDLPVLWTARSTTSADRKRLLRVFIHEIWLESVDPIYFTIAIHWTSGAVTQHTAFLPRGPARLAYELKRQGKSLDEITEELSRRGARTRRGQVYGREELEALFRYNPEGSATQKSVSWHDRREELRPLLAELVAAGRLNDEIAAEFQRRGVPGPTPTRSWTWAQIAYLRKAWQIPAPGFAKARREALRELLSELAHISNNAAVSRELQRREVPTVSGQGRWSRKRVAYFRSQLRIGEAAGRCATTASFPDSEPEAA